LLILYYPYELLISSSSLKSEDLIWEKANSKFPNS
jgi:hypothetical protein